MSRTIRIQQGQVWVSRSPITRTPSRRVVALAESKICYSTGGDRTRWCRIRAFRAWVRRYAAVATRTRRTRSLVLRKNGAR